MIRSVFFSLLASSSFLFYYVQFRLFIITSRPAHMVPTTIAAHANIIEFSQSRDGLVEQFLYRFIKLEKPRIHGTLYQVEQVSWSLLNIEVTAFTCIFLTDLFAISQFQFSCTMKPSIYSYIDTQALSIFPSVPHLVSSFAK